MRALYKIGKLINQCDKKTDKLPNAREKIWKGFELKIIRTWPQTFTTLKSGKIHCISSKDPSFRFWTHCDCWRYLVFWITRTASSTTCKNLPWFHKFISFTKGWIQKNLRENEKTIYSSRRQYFAEPKVFTFNEWRRSMSHRWNARSLVR